MSSNGAILQSIFDTLFGCCVRPRRSFASGDGGTGNGSGGFSSSDLARSHGGAHDERTPLLAGQQREPDTHRRQNASSSSPGTRGNDRAAKGKPRGGIASTREPNETKAGVDGGEKVRRKNDVDVGRLATIRDQAQAAFFNVDSSQLLPSSSSLAQRQAGMGTSQRLNRRDEEETSYAAHQRKELIAASDKAERLYTAAMKSKKAEGMEVAEDSGEGSSHAVNAATTAPVGLVRQVRLSVCDTKARLTGQDNPASHKSDPARTETAVTTTITPPEEDSHDRPLSSGAVLHKLPSVHSLRMLRLGVAPPSTPGVDANDDLALLLGQSAHSTATGGDRSGIAVSESTTDDERWEQRGRTRSRRGLVWMETQKEPEEAANTRLTSAVGADDSSNEQTDKAARDDGRDGKVKLDEMWKKDEEEIEDQIQYGLRFETKSDAESRKKLEEQLARASMQPLAVMWDETVEA